MWKYILFLMNFFAGTVMLFLFVINFLDITSSGVDPIQLLIIVIAPIGIIFALVGMLCSVIIKDSEKD